MGVENKKIFKKTLVNKNINKTVCILHQNTVFRDALNKVLINFLPF